MARANALKNQKRGEDLKGKKLLRIKCTKCCESGRSIGIEEPRRAANLSEHLSIIPDPRVERGKEHSLHDVLMIAILGMLCGAESFVDFEDFGKAKEEWLRGFLALQRPPI